jgi:class 3 adenylate cyclase
MGVMSLLRSLYRRLGARYVRVALVGELAGSHVVVAFGVAAILLYEPMSTGELVALLVVAEALMAIENVLAYQLSVRLLAPAEAWLRDGRSPAEAWRALTAMPVRFLENWRVYPVLGNILPFCAFATWELGLPWWSFAFLAAGGAVVLIYGIFLRFFVTELVLGPVVEDVARELAEEVQPGDAGVSLKVRLLLGLPMLNIITGVIVAGLSDNGREGLAALGLDVLIAVAVAFTLAFELTLLLTRSIVGPLRDLEAATERVTGGDLGVRVPVTTTHEAGRLAQAFNRMVAGLQERATLHEAFGAYVDPEVTERVLAEGAALEAEEVEVSVMFVDIRGFTARAERSTARDTVEELNAFYDCVVPVVTRRGGHANKFVGDGMLAVFGAPEPRSDHADRAVAAALEIAEAVRERFGGELEIGVGVNSGRVVAGTVGGGGRMEFTVIGDTVNTACRVEAVTRETGDDVLITEATRERLSGEHGSWTGRPAIPLRGKRAEVRLYAPPGRSRFSRAKRASSVRGPR